MVYKKNFVLKKKLSKSPSRLRLNIFSCTLFLPNNWNLYVVQGGAGLIFFYLSSATYKFNFFLEQSTHRIRYASGGLLEILFSRLNRFLPLFLSNVRQLLFLFSTPFFKKIKFRGKGYYIYKNRRNTIAPQFGYSHRIYVYSYFNVVRFLSKVKIFIFGLLKSDVLRTSCEIRSKRPINIFTGRGVRFSRQIIYKKVGKVSSYR